MQTRLSALFTLPLVMLLGGCPVWGSDNSSGGGTTDSCRTHGDCDVGTYCDGSGRCVASNTCASDVQCTLSQNCDFRDTCVPDVAGACRYDADCESTDVCIEGFCREVGVETCQFDLECATNNCVDNACTPTCSSTSQCGSGQVCNNLTGRCEVNATECDTSSQCSGNEHCVDRRCLPDCESSSCSDAQDTCGDDHFCRPSWEQAGFCSSNTQCAPGSTCDIPTGVCRIVCTAASPLVTGYSGGSCGGSFATADCACQSADAQFPTCGITSSAGDDDFCRTAGEQMSDCQTRSDCASNQHCVDGACE
jgi:hypothetical protein